MLARILRSMSHMDFIIPGVCSDVVEYGFVDAAAFTAGANCILNLDGNISHICPDKSNAIQMPFILIESDE